MQKLNYILSRGVTEITIGDGLLDNLKGLEDALIVYPENLGETLAPLLKNIKNSYMIGDGEASKNLDTVIDLLNRLKDLNFKRSSRLVSVGGGTVSDIAGMAASLYLRGIRYTSVPTTLLSMVDASLGGKTGVNFRGVKNVLGTFYSPDHIIIDLSLVRKMPHNLIEDGIGEIAKYAIIMDIELYRFLMENTMDGILSNPEKTEYLISRCISDKMEVVAQDEFDLKGRRAILNYGHTFGHAIEALSGFSVGHGHAVLGGMLLETDFALSENLISNEVRKGLHDLIAHFGFSLREEDYVPGKRSELAEFVASDKKSNRTSIMIPVPERVGMPKVSEVELSCISDYLERQ